MQKFTEQFPFHSPSRRQLEGRAALSNEVRYGCESPTCAIDKGTEEENFHELNFGNTQVPQTTGGSSKSIGQQT